MSGNTYTHMYDYAITLSICMYTGAHTHPTHHTPPTHTHCQTFAVDLEAVTEEIAVSSEVVTRSSDWQLLAPPTRQPLSDGAVAGGDGDSGLALSVDHAAEVALFLLHLTLTLISSGIQHHTERTCTLLQRERCDVIITSLINHVREIIIIGKSIESSER